MVLLGLLEDPDDLPRRLEAPNQSARDADGEQALIIRRHHHLTDVIDLCVEAGPYRQFLLPARRQRLALGRLLLQAGSKRVVLFLRPRG